MKLEAWGPDFAIGRPLPLCALAFFPLGNETAWGERRASPWGITEALRRSARTTAALFLL